MNLLSFIYFVRCFSMSSTEIYSVSDINRIIKLLIEENIPSVWIEGEISNYKPHYSGHIYFTLKDSNAQISAVMWKSRTVNLAFEPEDGMLVQAFGSVRLYEKSGRYQIDIVRMQPAGIGNLQLAFEKLKRKLDAEGLFDPSIKKPIPNFPENIGIITSETGAAIQDIVNIIKRRAPHVQLILRSAKVQGAGAAEDIAQAIEEFNQYDKVELIIAGRGGGSYEDLWAFNEEIVARAIHASKIPIISAVGHEIDYSISDFVADLRAPTPSAAAELAVPDTRELRENILSSQRRMHDIVQIKIKMTRERINYINTSYSFKKPIDLLRQYALQVDELASKLNRSVIQLIKQNKEFCDQLYIRLSNLDPKKVLERGYCISFIGQKIIKTINDVNVNTEMRTKLATGNILSTISQKESK